MGRKYAASVPAIWGTTPHLGIAEPRPISDSPRIRSLGLAVVGKRRAWRPKVPIRGTLPRSRFVRVDRWLGVLSSASCSDWPSLPCHLRSTVALDSRSSSAALSWRSSYRVEPRQGGVEWYLEMLQRRSWCAFPRAYSSRPQQRSWREVPRGGAHGPNLLWERPAWRSLVAAFSSCGSAIVPLGACRSRSCAISDRPSAMGSTS